MPRLLSARPDGTEGIMLTITNFSKTYAGGKKAVDNLSLTVNAGEIMGFIGHNGAGKTTTLRAVAGILDFTEGEIVIDGHSVKDEPVAAKQVTAFLPDNPDLYEFLTGIKYLAFIADIYGISKDVREERIRKYADAFELTGALGSPIGGYSHGMKQKLAVISALIRAPRLLILDEPFVGLDPQAAFVLKGFLREICAAGGAVFFSTHVLEVAEKLCDRIAIIKGMAFLALYLSGVYSFLLASMLAEVGIVEMVLPLMALMACVMSLMFTLFAASGLVFGGKDSDIVLALPVPAFTVMLSKILALYLENLVFCGLWMLPTGAAYLVYAGLGAGQVAGFCVRLLAAALFLPLLPSVLALLGGWVIAYFSGRMKHKSLVGTVLSIVLTGAVLVGSLQINGHHHLFAEHRDRRGDAAGLFGIRAVRAGTGGAACCADGRRAGGGSHAGGRCLPDAGDSESRVCLHQSGGPYAVDFEGSARPAP